MRVLLALFCASVVLAQKQPLTVETMLRIERIGEPVLSPSGRMVAFTVQIPDVAQNTKPQQIYVVPIEGGTPRQLTQEGSSNERPRWSPDSRQIYFISNRGGSDQIWVMDADGGHSVQITHLSTEAGGLLVTPDGKRLVFTSSVYPVCGDDDVCNKRKLDEEAQNKVKARIYTSLLFRHWNQWQGDRRQHLLTVKADGTEVKDLTPGLRDVPPFSLGGPDDYAVSPDSTELAFVMNADPEPALSTNSDIYEVSLDGGDPRKITTSPGADNSPQYSPDGKLLAFRSQARAGYESDRFRLVVLDRTTGRSSSVTEGLDRWVGSFTWSPDSTRLFFTVEDRGRTGLQMVPATGGGSRNIISGSSSLDDVQFTSDGRTMIYTEESGSRPAEIYKASSGGGPEVALTHLNDALLSGVQLTALDEMYAESPDKTRIHAFIVKPPGFTETGKYPVIFLIHGGPQGAWGESWTYRWNAQVFAAAGYLVVMPNPRGSTGYGQKFIDDINGDWGGKAYDDIMAVADSVAALKYVDPDRMAAAGGSYGGYMVDWILGHTTRFKALVSHDGVFDLRSMALSTEELWFPEWEFKGMPWDNPEMYSRWSPSYFVKDFKTPTLVIHGEEDYRVPLEQGLQLFTALQIQKVPSKLLEFPNEGHWVLKPQDSVLWYHTVLDWIGEWVKQP
ncbi:MAG TPA: S9 family peptidase [Bryobacteraceae bacterium]|jgi:dipeptidyl aminopeptidase/acylaminoacyl peptidase